jgi:cation transport protein ChaC
MDDAFWVFGYGSLMWRPGFDYVERKTAVVRGYHRRLCIYSHVHRGTPERPGLVLGLDRGGSCRGVAFRVPGENREATIAYLRERELVTSVYVEKWISIRLDRGGGARALAYVVDRGHHQYAARLDREASLRLVAQGVGQSGANPDYVLNTAQHLVELGIRDNDLMWHSERLRSLASAA